MKTRRDEQIGNHVFICWYGHFITEVYTTRGKAIGDTPPV